MCKASASCASAPSSSSRVGVFVDGDQGVARAAARAKTVRKHWLAMLRWSRAAFHVQGAFLLVLCACEALPARHALVAPQPLPKAALKLSVSYYR